MIEFALLVLCGVALWPSARMQIRERGNSRPSRRRPRRPPSGTAARWVAQTAELVAMALLAGLPVSESLKLALREGIDAHEPQVGRQRKHDPEHAIAAAREVLLGAHTAGSSPGQEWERVACESASAELQRAAREVAAVWRISEQLGSPLAPLLSEAAASIRQRQEARQRLRAATAGQCATIWLLTALPVLGIAVTVISGSSLASVYLSSTAARGSTLLGVCLCALGWLVARWILRRAERPC